MSITCDYSKRTRARARKNKQHFESILRQNRKFAYSKV